jgi:hypothetical protein
MERTDRRRTFTVAAALADWRAAIRDRVAATRQRETYAAGRQGSVAPDGADGLDAARVAEDAAVEREEAAQRRFRVARARAYRRHMATPGAVDGKAASPE